MDKFLGVMLHMIAIVSLVVSLAYIGAVVLTTAIVAISNVLM